jgi:hypothetical protein
MNHEALSFHVIHVIHVMTQAGLACPAEFVMSLQVGKFFKAVPQEASSSVIQQSPGVIYQAPPADCATVSRSVVQHWINHNIMLIARRLCGMIGTPQCRCHFVMVRPSQQAHSQLHT